MAWKCWTIAALLATCSPAFAEGITLGCSTSRGEPTPDLHVDLGAKTVSWGILSYRITSITDRYISAYSVGSPTEVGGESWVLDRVSGDYKRAAVAILYTQFVGSVPVNPTLEANTYTGKCTPKLF